MKYTKIKNIKQYNEYCDLLEKYISSDESSYKDDIDLLEILIYDFDKRVGVEKLQVLNPVELLKSFLSDFKMTQVELARSIDISPQLVSDIMNYRRSFSKVVIKKLAEYFSVNQEAFNRSYELKDNKRNIKGDNRGRAKSRNQVKRSLKKVATRKPAKN